MQESTPHPFDFASLNKGDIIEAARIASITSTEVGSPAYAFAVLGLRDMISSQLAMMGRPVTVIIRDSSLAILTDPEAAIYNAKRFRSGIRSARSAHGRNCAVDIEALNAEQRSAHEHNLITSARILQSIREAKQAIHIEAAQTAKQITGQV